MGRPIPYIGTPSEVNYIFNAESTRPPNAGRVAELRGVIPEIWTRDVYAPI